MYSEAESRAQILVTQDLRGATYAAGRHGAIGVCGALPKQWRSIIMS